MPYLVEADGSILLSALAAAGLIAVAGAGLMGLAVIYRQGESLYRWISALSGTVLLVFAGSLVLPPLAGVIVLTLTTAVIYVGVAGAYLSGATEEAAEEVPEPVPQSRYQVYPAGHRARSFTLPVNTSLALSLKSETWKPEGRLTL